MTGDDFRLYSGEDAQARDYVLQGGDGVISVTANVAPGTVSKVMAAAAAQDAPAASAADSSLSALHRDLFVEANPIPVKWALARMGRYAPSTVCSAYVHISDPSCSRAVGQDGGRHPPTARDSRQ